MRAISKRRGVSRSSAACIRKRRASQIRPAAAGRSDRLLRRRRLSHRINCAGRDLSRAAATRQALDADPSGADSADVASSIAFTAVLGVIVVLALPLMIPLVGLTGTQYGVLAGLTVYAVPQVLAATAPIGAIAVQTGTLVN